MPFAAITSSHLTFGLFMSVLVVQWLLRGLALFISGQNISAEMDNVRKNLEVKC